MQTERGSPSLGLRDGVWGTAEETQLSHESLFRAQGLLSAKTGMSTQVPCLFNISAHAKPYDTACPAWVLWENVKKGAGHSQARVPSSWCLTSSTLCFVSLQDSVLRYLSPSTNPKGNSEYAFDKVVYING